MTSPPFLHDLVQQIRKNLQKGASIFYMDLRSLAVFRGVLGFILVWDLMELSKDFRCFLTVPDTRGLRGLLVPPPEPAPPLLLSISKYPASLLD